MDIKSLTGTDIMKTGVLERANQYNRDVNTDRGQDMAENRAQTEKGFQGENKGFNIDTSA